MSVRAALAGASDQALAKAVERFGSPVFVYDGERLTQRYGRLRAALPEACAVHFAVKANPSLGVLALLVRAGAGLEIASVGELRAAQAVGCPPERVLYAGPGKRDEELAAALDAGVEGIHCESVGELARLDALARGRGRRIRCGVRVHVPWSAGEAHRIIGGGAASKFGISAREALDQAGEWTRAYPGLELIGLHVFNASNVLDADALLAGARRTLDLAGELSEAGLPLERVDFGGGLGVPYADETELDVERLGAGLDRLWSDWSPRFGGRLDLALEPGRWLAADAGRFVATVVDTKRCGDQRFATLDGGVHHLLRPALVGQAHRARRVDRGDCPGSVGADEAAEPVQLVGPLCTSLDAFGAYELPPLRVGDRVAFECAGAYGFTESMPRFLSHPTPAEVLLLDGRTHLLRERFEPERHLEGQHLPFQTEPAVRSGAGPKSRSQRAPTTRA